jgi:flagellar biosynthesis/type III secretory pathway chaperone
MNVLLDDLQKLLRQQIDIYKKLFFVLRRENEIILSSSVDDLNNNNKKKEVVILQIKLLDESCAKVIEKIYRHIPDASDPPTLAHLVTLHDDPAIQPVKSCYATLLGVARKVRELNTANERLIKGSLRAIMSSISFLTQCAASGSPCYENSGQLKLQAVTQPLLSEEA